jgi:hypothetical protein
MNQPACPKFFNMMGYGGKGDVKFFGHRAHGQAVIRIQSATTMPGPYLFKDCHAVLIGQGLKGFYHAFSLL